jgi:hypothetical protein
MRPRAEHVYAMERLGFMDEIEEEEASVRPGRKRQCERSWSGSARILG